MSEEIKTGEDRSKTGETERPLEEMTVKELREIARGIPDLSGFSVMKKEELIAVISEHRGIPIAPEAEAEKPLETDKPLEKMTAKELREIAKEIPGVTGVTAMKKEELLEVIKEKKGIKEEKPEKPKPKKAGKPTLNVRDLKEKIRNLRAEKISAREARDRRKVQILRRRINRIKKQTRKVAQG
jgi:cell division protein FtsX